MKLDNRTGLDIRYDTKTGDHASEPSFNEVLRGTIINTLTDIFGKKAASRILKSIESVYSMKLEDIPENGLQFEDALESLLGRGYIIIIDLILETLFVNQGQEYVYVENYGFSDYINRLMKMREQQVS
jgi:hypothetical protein